MKKIIYIFMILLSVNGFAGINVDELTKKYNIKADYDTEFDDWMKELIEKQRREVDQQLRFIKTQLKELHVEGYILSDSGRDDFQAMKYYPTETNWVCLSFRWNSEKPLNSEQKRVAEKFLRAFFYDIPYRLADFIFNKCPKLIGKESGAAVLHITDRHLYYKMLEDGKTVQLFIESKFSLGFAERFTEEIRARMERGRKIKGDKQ